MRFRHRPFPVSFALVLAVSISACATITPPVGIISESSAVELRTSFNQSLAAINTSLQNSQAVAANAVVVSNFLDAGMGLADLQCKSYFKNLGLAAQHYSFARKELGLTGGLVAGLQGLTGASAKAIAVTSSMFSFGTSSSENYADVFLFSPDISGLQELVEGAQRAYRDTVAAQPIRSYGAAVERLRDYDKLCEVQTIRRLVNESVSTARFETDENGEVLVSSAERYALAQAIGEPIVSSMQAVAIYWLVMGAPTTADKALIIRQLAGLPFFVDTTGALVNLTVAQQAAIKRVLAPLAVRNEARLSAAIASLRGAGTGNGGTTESTGGASGTVPQARSGGSISIRVRR